MKIALKEQNLKREEISCIVDANGNIIEGRLPLTEKVSREEAKAWLYDLYKNQSKHDHIIFCSRVDATISAIEYLKMNNKIV